MLLLLLDSSSTGSETQEVLLPYKLNCCFRFRLKTKTCCNCAAPLVKIWKLAVKFELTEDAEVVESTRCAKAGERRPNYSLLPSTCCWREATGSRIKHRQSYPLCLGAGIRGTLSIFFSSPPPPPPPHWITPHYILSLTVPDLVHPCSLSLGSGSGYCLPLCGGPLQSTPP